MGANHAVLVRASAPLSVDTRRGLHGPGASNENTMTDKTAKAEVRSPATHSRYWWNSVPFMRLPAHNRRMVEDAEPCPFCRVRCAWVVWDESIPVIARMVCENCGTNGPEERGYGHGEATLAAVLRWNSRK